MNVVGFLVVLSTVGVVFAFVVVFWSGTVLLVDASNFVEAVLLKVVSFLVDFDVGAIEDVVLVTATKIQGILYISSKYDRKKKRIELEFCSKQYFLTKKVIYKIGCESQKQIPNDVYKVNGSEKLLTRASCYSRKFRTTDDFTASFA